MLIAWFKKLKHKRLLKVIGILAAIAAISFLWQWAAEDDIREAIYIQQIELNIAGADIPKTVYYVSEGVENFCINPRKSLLNRLEDKGYIVKPASECTAESDSVFDNSIVKKGGVILNTGWVFRIGINKAIVMGDYFRNGTNASCDIYYLERKNGKWVIIRDILLWIS